MMTHRYSILLSISMLLILISCNSQEAGHERQETLNGDLKSMVSKSDEPHRYGGWYCPDNFGFVPVNIQDLDEIPAISDRLPTEQELQDNKSLIRIETEKYPDARALEMDLPRVARVYSERKGMSELIIVIQAIVIQEDTIVGYRFVNGGNGSARINDVTFLSKDEVDDFGSQPFFYSHSTWKASTKDIWSALGKTDFFKELGAKFGKQEFFSSAWDPESKTHLDLETDGERATGFVGMIYGNYYLHIDYDKDGFHYSEKMLMIENEDDNSTEFFFACGPYPENFEKKKSQWANWIAAVKKASETD